MRGTDQDGLPIPIDHWSVPRTRVQRYQFTGQYIDDTTLFYMNARYMDPQLGIFLSPDTLVPDPGNLFDYNRYMYVRGNPMKYTDPSGHCIAEGQDGWDSAENSQCRTAAANIAGIGGLDYIQNHFGGYESVKQWLDTAMADPNLDLAFLKPHADPLHRQWCNSSGLIGQGGCGGSYVENPAPPRTIHTLPDCSKVDCTTLLINGAIVGLDTVSLYAAGGAVTAQGVAIGCGVTGMVPCAAAAEGVAGTLGAVSTVASIAGTGLTVVQLVRGQATTTDLAVSVTSTLIGAKAPDYLLNAGASEAAAKFGGTAAGFGASYLQYRYDTK